MNKANRRNLSILTLFGIAMSLSILCMPIQSAFINANLFALEDFDYLANTINLDNDFLQKGRAIQLGNSFSIFENTIALDEGEVDLDADGDDDFASKSKAIHLSGDMSEFFAADKLIGLDDDDFASYDRFIGFDEDQFDYVKNLIEFDGDDFLQTNKAVELDRFYAGYF
jgi:hypothetical protein